MRIFVIPSWCPTTRSPLRGTFFFEQARAVACLRPDWKVGIVQYDLEGSMVPWRPQRWTQYIKDFSVRPGSNIDRTVSNGLHIYRVWQPFLPTFKRAQRFEYAVNVLAGQIGPSLDDFSARFGQPDLLHAHAGYPGAGAAALLSGARAIPYVISEHIGPFPPRSLVSPQGAPHSVLTKAYGGASAVSAVSTSLASRLKELNLASSVAVLPNFLDTSFGAAVTPPHAPPFVFLCVGPPSFEKGTDVLLRAFASLKNDARLRIVGTSPEVAAFRELAECLDLGHRVAWEGSVPRKEMPYFYAGAHALVSPSAGETFGVALIEALACGRPLIATKCGGPEDIVTAENGMLVPVGNPTALAQAMDQIMRTGNLYKPIALRADFLSRFSAPQVIEQLETWYRSALK